LGGWLDMGLWLLCYDGGGRRFLAKMDESEDGKKE
jgi:hypothetical protein